MPLEFSCPSCGNVLKAPFAAAGVLGACPKCNAQIIAPRKQGEDAVLSAPPPGTPLSPPPGSGLPAGFPDPMGLPSYTGATGFGAPRPGSAVPGAPPYAPQKVDNPLDAYPLPEEGDYGGFVARGVAYLVDTLLIALLAGILNPVLWPRYAQWVEDSALSEMGPLYSVAQMFPFFLLSVIYGTLFEGSGRQATIGKRITGIFVTTSTGDPMTFWRALWRNTVKYAALNVTCGLAIFVPLVNEMRQGVHDSLSGTLVLNR